MVSSLRFTLIVGLLFVGSKGSNGVTCADQITCEAPQLVGTTQAGFERLNEASSLALSTDKKYLYTANDSGAENAEVFAIDKANGQVAKVFSITGIRNEDFGGGGMWGDHECMTVNNCPHNITKKCIFVGDTGHNWVRWHCPNGDCPDGVPTGVDEHDTYKRDSLYPQSFIVFEEPKITSADGSKLEVRARRFPFTFPNGKQFDVEACVVKDPQTIQVFTKENTQNGGNENTGANDGGYEYSHAFTYEPP